MQLNCRCECQGSITRGWRNLIGLNRLAHWPRCLVVDKEGSLNNGVISLLITIITTITTIFSIIFDNNRIIVTAQESPSSRKTGGIVVVLVTGISISLYLCTWLNLWKIRFNVQHKGGLVFVLLMLHHPWKQIPFIGSRSAIIYPPRQDIWSTKQIMANSIGRIMSSTSSSLCLHLSLTRTDMSCSWCSCSLQFLTTTVVAR